VFKPVTGKIIANAQELAAGNGLEIEYIRRAGAFRKEDRIAQILTVRGQVKGWCISFHAWKYVRPINPGMTWKAVNTISTRDRRNAFVTIFISSTRSRGYAL
jgi:hypothetical protein